MLVQPDFLDAETEALSSPLKVGAVIDGRYELLAQISQGGMGTVFRALDLRTDETVALKAALPHLVDGADRTLREAEILGAVAMHGVPTLRDFGRLEGNAYFVMDLVDGDDLEGILMRERRIAPERAVEVMASVARTLALVHSRGIVHCDVKPANIVLGRRDETTLLDFGISTFPKSDADSASVDVTGSPRYMSPEQIMGKAIDHRTDIWSFGITFYEALVGAPPFNRPTLTAILTAMLTERVIPPSEIVPELPAELDAILLRCLAMDPDHRYDDVAQLLRDLAELPPIESSARSYPKPRISGVVPIGLASETGESVVSSDIASATTLEDAGDAPVFPLVRRLQLLKAA